MSLCTLAEHAGYFTLAFMPGTGKGNGRISRYLPLAAPPVAKNNF